MSLTCDFLTNYVIIRSTMALRGVPIEFDIRTDKTNMVTERCDQPPPGQEMETIEELKRKILMEVTRHEGLYPEELAGRLGISHKLGSDLTTEMVREGLLGTR